MSTPLLDAIKSPGDLRELDRAKLPELAEEIRHFIIEVINRAGGHLSSNLGVVELTVALLYCYEVPEDDIIWDVGHQSYVYKILTDRKDRLETIRQWGGLSGFPSRAESEYDSFGTAHASTSISAGLGIAVAKSHLARDSRVAVIIGDGALSGGMAFEALNNASNSGVSKFLVILNDNEMSISAAVGAIHNYLGRILASKFYNKMRIGGRNMLSINPPLQKFARRVHEHAKGMILPGTIFEEFGFNYAGPIDGHDVLAWNRRFAVCAISRACSFCMW